MVMPDEIRRPTELVNMLNEKQAEISALVEYYEDRIEALHEEISALRGQLIALHNDRDYEADL